MRKPVEWLVNEYQKNLFAAAYAICGNAEDARDAVQDTFIRYYTSKKEFNDEQHIRAWLLRVAVNRAHDMNRSFWRRNTCGEYSEELESTPMFENEEESDLFIMKKQNSTNNTNDDIETSIELSYTMAEDGILYSNISFETENLAELGKYGLMAMNYLKDNYYERYRLLERNGRLVEVLKPVNEEAHQMVYRMMDKYMKKRVKYLRCTQVCKSRYFTNENTETQVDVQTHKPNDPTSTMEMWKIREQGLMQAEEIVIHEIVNKYH